MSEVQIFEGKTTNEAIERGLKELKANRNDVDIKVLEEEKRSFFSILEKRTVKVEIKLKEDVQKKSEIIKKDKISSEEDLEVALKNVNSFLDKWLPTLEFKNIEYTSIINDGFVEVNITGEDSHNLIGYRGETLNSIQIVLSSIAGKDIKGKVKINLNISGYKEKREKILIALANKQAIRVIKTRKSVALEPMTAYERKIVHSALQEHPKVTTRSVGEGSNRKVIIYLK